MKRGGRQPTEELLKQIEQAIRARGTHPFAAHEIGAEVGVCRQTVYKHIRRLVEAGHRIEGEPQWGFSARME